MRITKNVDFFFCFLVIYFDFFLPLFCPFACLFKGSLLPVIILLLHEMLSGFLSNKGRNLIGKEQ